MKEVTEKKSKFRIQNSKLLLVRLFSLLLVETFLSSSILPAWALPQENLRPRSSPWYGEKLLSELESGTEAKDGGKEKGLPYGRRKPLDKHIARQIPLLTPDPEAWGHLLSFYPKLKEIPNLKQRVLTTFSAVAWNVEAWIEAKEVVKARKGLQMGHEFGARLKQSAHEQFERITRGRKLSEDEVREAWRELDWNRQLAFRVFMTAAEAQQREDQLILRLNIGIAGKPILIDLHLFPTEMEPQSQHPILIKSRISSPMKRGYSFALVTKDIGDERRRGFTASDGGNRRYPTGDAPNAYEAMRKELKTRKKEYGKWHNTPRRLQKGIHADQPLYRFALELERSRGTYYLPRERRRFDFKDPRMLVLAQEILKERTERGLLNYPHTLPLKEYQLIRRVEAAHEVRLLPRKLEKRPFDTLEGWRRFFEERIVHKKPITFREVHRTTHRSAQKKLVEIQRKYHVQLALKMQGFKGLTELSVEVAYLIWTLFDPHRKERNPEEDAKQILHALGQEEKDRPKTLALLAAFMRNDLLQSRTEAFLATEKGQNLLNDFKKEAMKEIAPMVLQGETTKHKQVTHRVIAWLTLAPKEHNVILRKIKRNKTLRTHWPKFRKSPLGKKFTQALEEAKGRSKKKLILSEDAKRFVNALRRGPLGQQRAAELLGYRRFVAVWDLFFDLQRKGVPVIFDAAGGYFVLANRRNATSPQNRRAKDGGAKSISSSLYHPSKDLLLISP